MLGQITLDKESIEQIVRGMVAEFSGEDEKLEVYLCPQDLSLLKSMADPEKPAVEEKKRKRKVLPLPLREFLTVLMEMMPCLKVIQM